MPKVSIRRAPNNRTYLNAGCGGTFSTEWNNIDLFRNPHVVYHDLRKPLPYPDGSFDAVYSSNALEHLTPEDGTRFVREMYRVCKVSGICRMVVPDYERACREYLGRLEEALANPTNRAMQRYRWSVIELIDQCVREKSGGKMLQALGSGDFDEEYVRERNGDQFASFYSSTGTGDVVTEVSGNLRTRIKRSRLGPWIRVVLRAIRGVNVWLRGEPNPRDSGQVHRWMYDRLSLSLLLKEVGFNEISICSFDQSSVPDWSRYYLDATKDGLGPRKPDSLYMEGRKLNADYGVA